MGKEIRKIAELTPREFPHLVQNHENICAQKLWCIQYLTPLQSVQMRVYAFRVAITSF